MKAVGLQTYQNHANRLYIAVTMLSSERTSNIIARTHVIAYIIFMTVKAYVKLCFNLFSVFTKFNL